MIACPQNETSRVVSRVLSPWQASSHWRSRSIRLISAIGTWNSFFLSVLNVQSAHHPGYQANQSYKAISVAFLHFLGYPEISFFGLHVNHGTYVSFWQKLFSQRVDAFRQKSVTTNTVKGLAGICQRKRCLRASFMKRAWFTRMSYGLRHSRMA